jgi:hypothetical protein
MIALDATVGLNQAFGQSAVPKTSTHDEVASGKQSNQTGGYEGIALGIPHLTQQRVCPIDSVRSKDIFDFSLRLGSMGARGMKPEQRFNLIVASACHRRLSVRDFDVCRQSGRTSIPRKGQFFHGRFKTFLSDTDLPPLACRTSPFFDLVTGLLVARREPYGAIFIRQNHDRNNQRFEADAIEKEWSGGESCYRG